MKREDAINPAQDNYVYTSVSGRLQQIKHLLNYQRASIVDMIHAISVQTKELQPTNITN